jgi:hypothetical protein
MKRRDVLTLRKLSAESSDGRGRVSEELLLVAVKRAGLGFPWFLFARPAIADEDSRGFDIVVFAREDERIYLQSKSSMIKALSFQSKKREDKIEVIVVSLDEEKNLRLVKEAMEKAYAEAVGLRGIDVGTQAPSGA